MPNADEGNEYSHRRAQSRLLLKTGGHQRSFALLRPANGDAAAQERIRDLVLKAYAEFEQSTVEP
jgi:hypothetical protein